MSLTAFNRLRRMKQEEAMKPENIGSSQEAVMPEKPQTVLVEEKPVEEVEEKEIEKPVEETQTSARRGRRASK